MTSATRPSVPPRRRPGCPDRLSATTTSCRSAAGSRPGTYQIQILPYRVDPLQNLRRIEARATNPTRKASPCPSRSDRVRSGSPLDVLASLLARLTVARSANGDPPDHDLVAAVRELRLLSRPRVVHRHHDLVLAGRHRRVGPHERALEQPAPDLPVGRAVAAAGERLLLLVPGLSVRAPQDGQRVEVGPKRPQSPPTPGSRWHPRRGGSRSGPRVR